MRIAIHPRLVEEADFAACRALESRGEPAPGAWLRRALERGYRVPPGPDRERRFERAHAVLFRRAGLSRGLRDLFAAHPLLARAGGGPVRVGPAAGRAKESVELFERRDGDGRVLRLVVASVLPATLADPAALAARLHRDALKVSDLLDPRFRWEEPDPEPTPARRETVRLRYGAAWDAYADGRLERRGLPAPESPERVEAAFLAAFGRALPEEEAAAACRRLREAEALTHGDLLRFARDPGTLPGATGRRREPGARASGPPAGSPCPLCRFPTHDWVPDPGALPPPVQVRARASAPGWEASDGLCGQCALLLEGAAATEAPPLPA